jgi:hypothetical protein
MIRVPIYNIFSSSELKNYCTNVLNNVACRFFVCVKYLGRSPCLILRSLIIKLEQGCGTHSDHLHTRWSTLPCRDHVHSKDSRRNWLDCWIEPLQYYLVFSRHGMSNGRLRLCDFVGRLYVIFAHRLERKLTGHRELHL